MSTMLLDTTLNLRYNNLTALPSEIGKITSLKELDLRGNQLTSLPPEIARFANLRSLDIGHNNLTALPPELSQLSKLVSWEFEGNPLISPPPEIIKQGKNAILEYLGKLFEKGTRQWISKMLLVGQGGVGKTALSRALRGERFRTDLDTTHGIEIRTLEFKHPTESSVTMQLNTWDFGGQEIYHATHQFFLTNRSLFLLVWNARHGFEQGRLYYWLDAIQALAPDSPILLVATQIDERDADLPLADLRAKYPQIVDSYTVSNKTGQGIKELRHAITNAAAKLPLMGEQWPTAWLNAANAIRAMPEKHVAPQKFFNAMASHGVTDTSQRVLTQWLHELGDILYFADHPELNDLVILKPQWVTEYISKALESDEVINQQGIFTRDHMYRLWRDLDPSMREHFLRLMERFDLSYRTLESRDVSLVVERLPLEKPDYTKLWETPRAVEEFHEISLKFRLNTIPAGIPTWFIARAHRFTTHTHWRNGAVFAESDRKHLALALALPHDRYLQLTVRGPYPHNFFALLKDGIELILARFPGLQVTRLIPCPGHNGKPCTHEFDYELLLKRLHIKPMIECPVTLEDVSVPEMLFGWDWNTRDAVLERLDVIEHMGEESLVELKELRALAQREFTNAFRRDQSLIESHCPNIFVLRPRDADANGIRKVLQDAKTTIAGRQIDLQLYCQAPGFWHPTKLGGRYQIDEPAKWIAATAPYLQRLITVLKYASPIVGPWFNLLDKATYDKVLKADLDFLNAVIKQIPDLEKEHPDFELSGHVGRADDPERVEGAALRALRALLDEKDTRQEWGGLRKVLTPEGHYLWLCNHHAQEYLR
ncbi:MAG: leucine-rich repeat domain-containing protein, partial [Chloroflexi bacterium]|nr:leucine-rich repeat domain-containing protein [Chloroflexota bacterium]